MRRRRRRLSPEEDALEHIVACTDKPFLEERFIDPSKGRGVFTHESIEPNTFVVEYRGNIFPLKELSKEKCGDTLNNYVFEFLWKDESWCIDASKEDGTFGRLVNDDHRNPNCKLRKIIYEGKPHVCLFALKKIYPGDEITFDYGESSYPWRSNESSDELVTSHTDVNSSSSKCSQEKCLKASTSQESCSGVSQPEDAFYSQEEDKTASSSDGAESDGDYIPNEAKTKPRRSSCPKKHSCYVCGKVVWRLSHHFLMHLKEDAEIAQLYCLPSDSKERKRLFQELQDRGNAKHQKLESHSGEMTKRHKSSVAMNVEAVVHSQKTEDAQEMTPGVRGMLIRMEQDEIAFTVQNDPLLLQLAQSLCDNYENIAGHANHDFTTNTLREMGRLLLILRKRSVFCFADAVKPMNFCKVVEAVKDFSGFSKVTQTYKNPAVALKLGNLVKKVGELVLSKAGNDEQLRSDTETFIKLCTQWQQLVSQAAASKTTGPKLSNPSTIPFIHDVQLFYKCLETTLASAVESLKTHEAPHFYNALASVTVAQVSVLNKCASEVSQMTLESFEEKETTQVLSKHFIRASIDKTNQKDTILLTTELVDAITLLVNKRDTCGVHKENAFLFAKPDFSATSFYHGNACIRIFASQCGAAKPEYLRAKEFYKHITRIFQILNLENDELEQLATLLGHSIQSKKEYYRLPEAAADIAKISKLLLTKEKGSLEKAQEQSLSGVEFVGELEPDTEQSNFENNDTEEEEEKKEEPGYSDVAKPEERQLTPEEDALEHIAACRDKPFLEERFIDFSKDSRLRTCACQFRMILMHKHMHGGENKIGWRGVFTLETIEPNTFVVEYRGNIISHPETHETSFADTLNNYVFDFSWNGTKWCIDASKEDGTLGRLVNDDHISPNCTMKKIVCDGKPHLCLFAVKKLSPGEEITYDYGKSSYLWRSRESNDGPSTSQTNQTETASSQLKKKIDLAAPVSAEPSAVNDHLPDSGPVHVEKSVKLNNPQCRSFKKNADFPGTDSSKAKAFVLQSKDESCIQQDDDSDSSWDDCSSDEDYNPNQFKISSRNRSNRRKNFCYVCGKRMQKLVNHLRTHKEEEPDIARAFASNKTGTERKKLIEELRVRGNKKKLIQEELKTQSGNLNATTIMSSVTTDVALAQCLYCKGMYIQKTLLLHMQQCRSKGQPTGKSMLMNLVATPTSAYLQGIPSYMEKLLGQLKDAEIASLIQKDFLMLQLAQFMYQKRKNQFKDEYIKQKLKDMGRLLLTLRKKSGLSLEEAVKPCNFFKLAEAVKEIVGFNEKERTWHRPHCLMKLVSSLKMIGEIILNRALTNGVKQRIEEAHIFNKLCAKEWGLCRTESRLLNPSTIPFTQDVQRLYLHLEDAFRAAIKYLQLYQNPQVYVALAKVTHAQVSIFNRRPSDVSELTVKAFNERQETETHKDTSVHQSEFDKVLSKHFVTVNILNTDGKKVGLLLTSELISAMKLLVDKRDACEIHKDNPFLFAKLTAKYQSFYGQESIMDFATRCAAKNPEYLRAVHFLNHIARVFKILKLVNKDLPHLATLLGVELRLEKEYYRLPEAAVDIAKISQLLLAAEEGSLERFRGKSLDQIEIADKLQPDVEQHSHEESTAEMHKGKSVSSPFQSGSSSPKTSLRGKCDTGASTKHHKTTPVPNSEKKNEVNKEKTDGSEILVDDDDNMDVDTNEEDGDSNHSAMTALATAFQAQRESQGKHLRQHTTKTGPFNKPSTSSEIAENCSKGPSRMRSNATVNETALKKDERNNWKGVKGNNLPVQLCPESNTPALMGLKDLKILIPKLDIRKLQTPIHTSQLELMVPVDSSTQLIHGKKNNNLKRTTSAGVANQPHRTMVSEMSCPHCKKSIVRGQTAYQKRGFPQVFCSKNCLFAVFPAKKTVTKTCHYCLKLIIQPQNIVAAPVDTKGTMKNFCNQTCLSSFKSNSGSPCSICSKCTASREVTLNGVVYKFCSKSCLELLSRRSKSSKVICANCSIICYNKPLKLKVDQGIKNICKEECLIKFKEKLKSRQQCTKCHTSGLISTMVESKSNEGVIELFCNSSCVTAYKSQIADSSGASPASSELTVAKSNLAFPASEKDLPSETETPYTVTTASSSTACFHCKKKLDKGQTIHQTKNLQRVFCSHTCFSAHHLHVKLVTKKCYNCNQNILQANTIILAPVDDTGIMKELCSEACLTSVSFKMNTKYLQSVVPWSQCKRCKRFHFCKFKLIVDATVLRICNDTCLLEYLNSNSIPLLCCDNCSALCNKPLTVKLRGGSKTICTAECLTKLKEKTVTPELCTMCQTLHLMSDMVEDEKVGGELDFFCSNRCMIVYKTQSGKNSSSSSSSGAKEDENPSASSLDFINDEPLECRQDIYSSIFSDDITRESNMAQKEQCGSGLTENSTSAPPEMETSNNEMETSNNEMETSNNEMETSNNEMETAPSITRMTFHKSCSHCKKVLVDGQSVYQRKGDIRLFCSTSCISIFDQVKPVKKNCDFCFQAFKQSESIIQAPADDGAMKNFCSQTCRASFNYKRIMSSKMPPAAPHSICSICSICTRYCISKHEVIFHDIVHKICSDPCLSRFYKINNLATCENCDSRCHNPLTLNIRDNNKAFCNEVCLAEFKQKIKSPQPCSGCCTPHLMSEMVENKNSENVIKLFCNDGCVMASKIQAVIESDASLNCDNCGKTTLPVCHLTMSDASLKNFCGLSCAMTFKETNKQIDVSSNTSKSPTKVVGDETLGDLQKLPEKLTCSQCGRTVKTTPKLIQLKDKMVFVCGLSCSDEFKRWNNIRRKCEYCKKERIIKDSKRVNNSDRHFCSNRCKLFFERGLKKKWGKHCQTCAYCFRTSKAIVTSKYRGKTFCSSDCSSKYNLLVRHRVKCDACGSEGKLMRILPMLGEVKRFCDVKCLLQFCISQAQFNTKDKHSASDSADNEELTQVTNNIVLLASTLNSQLAASSSTAQQGAVCGMEAKVTEQASTQTVAENVPCPPVPKVLANKALLCMSLVHNKGVSCTKRAVDRQTQTDELVSTAMPLPVPVPVYVPVPMNMYSQYTPKPVGFPFPVPVPIFLTAISDSSEPTEETIQETAHPDAVNEEVDLKADMVTNQDKKEEEKEQGDREELKERQENAEDHTKMTTNDMNTVDQDSVIKDQDSVIKDQDSVIKDQDSVIKDQDSVINDQDSVINDQDSVIKDQEDPSLDTSLGLPSSPHSNSKVTQGLDVSVDIPTESYAEPTPLSPPPATEEKTQPSHGSLNVPPILSQLQATRKVQSRQKGRRVQQGPKVETFHKTSTKETVSMIPQTLNSQYAINVWKNWMQWRHCHPSLGPLSSELMEVKRDILRCTADNLRCALNYFINEVKYPNGEPYSPDGLFYLCLGIQQYLFENGRMENIFSDLIYYEFTVEFTRVLKSFNPRVTAGGCIRSCVEEEFLWDCKQLGAYSPIVLLNTLLFFCCKYFGFATVKQQRQLSFARIKLFTKTNWNNTRTTFLRFYPSKSDTTEADTDADGVPAKKRKKSESEGEFLEIMENTENPLRCPVRLYEFYLSKCLASMKQRSDLFYLHPVNSCSPRSPVWFSSTPLDDSTIDAVLIRFLTVRKMKARTAKPGRSGKKQQRPTEASVIPEEN